MNNTFYRPQETNTREFDQIVSKLEKDFEELLSGMVEDEELKEYLTKLVCDQNNFNDEMGFWGLDDPATMPGDARVDYFYMPTYYSTAIMIYSLINYSKVAKEVPDFMAVLGKGLMASTGRAFKGSGYDESIYGELNTMTIFAKAKAYQLKEKYPDICSKFTDLFINTMFRYCMAINNGNSKKIGGFWEGTKDLTQEYTNVLNLIDDGKMDKLVFVYGTLMEGKCNHAYYLNERDFVAKATLQDYALYDLGSYPGVKLKDGYTVKGEIYSVDEQTLVRLNWLEMEGTLYKLEEEEVPDSSDIYRKVLVYVYIDDVSDDNLIEEEQQPWKG